MSMTRLLSLDAYDMTDVTEEEAAAYPDDQRDAWDALQLAEADERGFFVEES